MTPIKPSVVQFERIGNFRGGIQNFDAFGRHFVPNPIARDQGDMIIAHRASIFSKNNAYPNARVHRIGVRNLSGH